LISFLSIFYLTAASRSVSGCHFAVAAKSNLDHNRSKQSVFIGELSADTQLQDMNGALPDITFLS